jgi:chaperonin GroES
MATLYPVGTMIMIEPEVQPELSRGGIIIPDSARERPAKGKVLQVPVKLETPITEGVTVFFPPNALKQFVVDDQLYCAVAEEHIYCYLK